MNLRFFLTFCQKSHVNFASRLAKSLSENFVKIFLYGGTVFLLSESSCSDSAAYAGFSPLRVESFVVLTESFKMMWESRVWRFCAFHTVGGVFLVLVWFFGEYKRHKFEADRGGQNTASTTTAAQFEAGRG